MNLTKEIERFVVLSHPRSGTSYFCGGILSGHKSIACYDEIFNNTDQTIKVMNNLGLKPFTRSNYSTSMEFLNLFYLKASQKRKKNNIGFKLFPDQVDEKTLFHILKTHKVLLLHRLNMPQAAISYMIAKNTGQWDSRFKKEFEPLELNYKELKKFIEDYKKLLNNCMDFLKINNIAYQKLYYESLFTQASLADVASFLQLEDPFNVKEFRKIKINGLSRYQQIKKIDDLRKQFLKDDYPDIFETVYEDAIS